MWPIVFGRKNDGVIWNPCEKWKKVVALSASDKAVRFLVVFMKLRQKCVKTNIKCGKDKMIRVKYMPNICNKTNISYIIWIYSVALIYVNYL